MVTLLMPLDRFCLNFSSGRSMEMTAKLRRKVTAASPVQERWRTFLGSHLSKNCGNGNTADNFVSPNTVDFKMQTSHTVRLKITATPQAGNFFHRNTAWKNAQHRKSPKTPSLIQEEGAKSDSPPPPLPHNWKIHFSGDAVSSLRDHWWCKVK